jgi:four helix bundle protein
MAKTFRDLDVYKKAFDVSLQMHKLSLTLPSIEQYALANQMRRASKSICANIAEGFGKQSSSKNEFRRFLSMAQGSCQEMKVWLEYCLALHYIQQSEYDEYCLSELGDNDICYSLAIYAREGYDLRICLTTILSLYYCYTYQWKFSWYIYRT